MIAAIVPAAGAGVRMEADRPKQFRPLGDRPLLVHTLQRLSDSPLIETVVVVVPADWVAKARSELIEPYGLAKVGAVVAGGAERQNSVAAGLEALGPEVDLVVVHDGVRPFVTEAMVADVVEAARAAGAAVAAIPVAETVKRVADGAVVETVSRDGLYRVQTPQAFRREVLAEALERARAEGVVGTDEAALVERFGRPVRVVAGSAVNLKVTSPEDWSLAESILSSLGRSASASKAARVGTERMSLRVGMGYDVHRFASGRPLILGGVVVPSDQGLEGHSDADVLAHAVCDALLGAAGAGDIGRHFPDTDPTYAGANSLDLLREVGAIVARRGFRPLNVDATVVLQEPKLKDFLPAMEANIAETLGIDPTLVNIKATTTEGLGFVGQGEGVAAYAAATIEAT
ncbi:MAG: 2-C-methyl-D-erythritol 4-phosphate cytidylyltransferase [bacterium]